jgi:hypothetical protein
MSVLELNVYDIFKTKIGDAEAKTIIEYFEAKAEVKLIKAGKMQGIPAKQLLDEL